MNILIIAPFYKHDRNIASVRWTNISTRLAKRHNVIMVTQPHDDMDMTMSVNRDEDNILVARINQKTSYEKFAVKHFGGATGDAWQTKSNTSADSNQTVQNGDSLVRKIKNRVLFASMKQKAKDYAKVIEKQVIPVDTKIDVIISSACPFIEMLFGYELKKRLNCKWICDFRDLPIHDEAKDDARIMKKLMQKSLACADNVVSITNSGKDFLSKGIVEDSSKIHVINNGFSMADARKPIRQNDKILHIVHTGSLYGGTRKADLFFKAAQKARKQNPNFAYVLECAGGNNESLIETAKKYGEEANVDNYGFIPREEALDMQAKSDILLALVINTIGSFVAKMFEYVLNQKPIICVTCGNIPNSEETDFVRKNNLGVAVEEYEANAADVLCEYLLKQFELKQNHQSLEFSPQIETLREYDHDSIVVRFESLF